jgi:hypothetical protein
LIARPVSDGGTHVRICFQRPLSNFWISFFDLTCKVDGLSISQISLKLFVFFSAAWMLLPYFNQFKKLLPKSTRQTHFAIAVFVILFLGALWHGGASITNHPLHYIAEYVDGIRSRVTWLIIVELSYPDLPFMK